MNSKHRFILGVVGLLLINLACPSEAPGREEPERSDAVDAGLVGLYRAFSIVRIGPGALPAEAYLFSVNLDVYKGWPGAQPLNSFDFARASREEPTKTGSYTLSDGSITFQWSDGTTKTTYFKPDPTKGFTSVEFSGLFWNRLVPWSNQQLNATYHSSNLDLGFPDDYTGFPDFERGHLEITFSSDGQFAIADRQSGETSGVRSSTGDRQGFLNGNYRIDDVTLTFIDSGNNHRDYDLYVLEESENDMSPGVIYINGRPFITPSMH